MTKKSIKAIENNNCNFYGVNTNTFYIKGEKFINQINLKKHGMGLYSVWSKDIKDTIMTEAQIIELTK